MFIEEEKAVSLLGEDIVLRENFGKNGAIWYILKCIFINFK